MESIVYLRHSESKKYKKAKEVKDMGIRKVKENKKQFLSLLLLADEQEDMIENIKNSIQFCKLVQATVH